MKRNITGFYLLAAGLSVAFLLQSCKSTKSTTQQPVNRPVVSTPPPQPKPKVIESTEVKKPEIVNRHFVLIMPFELEQNFAAQADEAMEPTVSQTSLSALNFYEGALMAVDSLKSQHVALNLNAYDTPGDSASVVRMMSSPAVKNADVVVGTFPNSLAPVAARAAKNYNINLVLTQAGSPDLLADNNNVALAFASTVTQCREMVAYMTDQYPAANIILIFRTIKREDELATFFRKEIDNRKEAIEFHEFNATDKDIGDVVGLLSKTRRNLVFVISSDEAFVSPVLSLMEEQNIYGIKVVGLPTWLNFESIDFMAYNNVQTHFFDNNFVENDPAPSTQFRKLFVNRFSNEPLPSAYNGFELVYHIGGAPFEPGKGIEEMLKAAFREHSSSFNFVNTINGGYENKTISVLTITDYKLERLNK